MRPNTKSIDVTQLVAPYSSRIIYIYTIPDEKHQGRLKIGATTLPANQLSTPENIEQAAHERIKQQTQTADVPYTFCHAEIAIQESIADIISWNLFQMDGLKTVIPMSCYSTELPVVENLTFQLFEELPALPPVKECPGCEFDLLMRHNGRYVQIMDWQTKRTERFVDSIAGAEF
jgi:hypothetical protein